MIQPPYTTGTATVTAGSAVVTGTTTAWALGLVSGGLFTRQGLAVPIVSVQSDTSLTLAYPWPGASGTGAYAIDLGRADAASAIVANKRLADVLDGIRGPFVEFRTSPDGVWVQFRNVGFDDPWTNLIPVASLPQGPQGLKGDTGDATSATTITATSGISWGTSRQPTQADWNEVQTGGVWMKSAMANAPGGATGWFYVIVQQHNGLHVSQTAINLSNGDMHERVLVGGAWQAWQAIWTTRTAPAATDAELDAGAVTAPRIPSPAGIHRAVRAERGVLFRGPVSAVNQFSLTGLATVRRLRLSGRISPSTAGRVYLQLSTNNGASWLQSNLWQTLVAQGTAVAAASGSTIFFPFSGDSNLPADVNQAVTFEMSIDLTPAQYARIIGHGSLAVSAIEALHVVAGRVDVTSGPVNALRILPAAGQISGFLNIESIRT